MPTENRKQLWLGLLLSAVLLGGVIAFVLLTADGSANRDYVSSLTKQERADTVPILQHSSASQGICYGWSLDEYDFSMSNTNVRHGSTSVGSNLGDGVGVEENAACPRWVQVVARVIYTEESSEFNDYATILVKASEDIPDSARDQMLSGLDRFGLTEATFVDEPGWAVARAAVSLPLLAAEAGLVGPAATPAPGAATPAPLPEAGNDLWRDRWGYLLATAGLLLFSALMLAIGFRQRNRHRRKEAERQARTEDSRADRQAVAQDPGRTPEGR
ncbi:hypothetical protein [Micromonospora sp. KLBMP9576]|uniref:hypothetical protein n=1 Tax=Micromonospora sp. KLBMP9576 TaxID=3424769 RepID=UPI003D8C4BAD